MARCYYYNHAEDEHLSENASILIATALPGMPDQRR